MTASASIAELTKALVKAQKQIKGAAKSSVNPHFKSKYADLSEVMDACVPALNAHGLAVLQPVKADGPLVTITTMLVHESGEYVAEDLTMTAVQNTPQGIGSAITYGRRYGLSALVGVAPEDDDGNAASHRPTHAQHDDMRDAMPTVAPEGFVDWADDLQCAADEGIEALKTAWDRSPADYKRHLTKTNPAEWAALKARAAKAGQPV